MKGDLEGLKGLTTSGEDIASLTEPDYARACLQIT